MVNPFKTPYKETSSTRSKLISILLFGLFIFLFLFLFKPFGLSQVSSKQSFFICLGFGLITSFVLIIFYFLFDPLIKRDSWSLGLNILHDVVVASSIGTANYFYIRYIFRINFASSSSSLPPVIYLLFAILTAILVGSIPVTIKYFIVYNKMYKSALKQADIPEEIVWDDEVTIRAGNPKNDFKFNPRNIVYLCSNDNYVTIVTIKGESQNKTTIRGTLRDAESELGRNSRFLRCHKCYIVNLDFVGKVTGHNQNMKIKLLPSGNEIPVSRSKADLVNKRIKKS
jgi:DNA-binding LytR/AlgR family response regulator